MASLCANAQERQTDGLTTAFYKQTDLKLAASMHLSHTHEKTQLQDSRNAPVPARSLREQPPVAGEPPPIPIPASRRPVFPPASETGRLAGTQGCSRRRDTSQGLRSTNPTTLLRTLPFRSRPLGLSKGSKG